MLNKIPQERGYTTNPVSNAVNQPNQDIVARNQTKLIKIHPIQTALSFTIIKGKQYLFYKSFGGD